MENMSVDLIIDNEVIDIPNEINIGMYQQINTNPTKYKNPLQLISLFTNITIHDLKNMKKEQVELIESVIGNKLVLPQENKLVMTFEYDGIEYGLENDWSKMAWGAWVDFEVYCADDKIYENLHRIMAILYRPITHKDKKNPLKYKIEPYKSQDIEARSEIMRLFPVSIWLGSALFFLEIVKTYINNINHSLSLMTKIQTKILTIWKKMPKWLKKVLPLASISPSLTSSQKKILQNFNK